MRDGSSSLLSPDLLASLSARGELHTFARGDMLITEGDRSDSLYILASGQLKVFTRDVRGRELIYNILQPGEFFGEMFLDGGPRSACVKAICPSQCIIIDHAEIRSLIRSNPDFAESLVLKLIGRVRHATQQIKSLALSGVYERAVDLINQLAIDEGSVRMIPPTLTQQEIADRVGATREMINHILRDLVHGGVLVRDSERRMVIAKELPKHW